MKAARIIIGSTILFAALASTCFFSSCADPCSSVICTNNGICRDGACVCAEGYEGPFCEERMNEKFIGTWDGTYRCNGNAPDTRTMIMAPGGGGGNVVLYDLFSQNETFTATVNGTDIEIPSQISNGWEYRGYGYVEGLYITLYIEQKDPLGNFNTCVYNATKFQE